MILSIIVPVYNMNIDGRLQYCMDSLVNQTIADYEIIAVDDKSTDDSLKILKEYEEKYPHKVKVIASPENRRQGGAKNLGLDVAKGQWVGFMDSDDWAASDMYEKLLKKAEETGADVVGCDYMKTMETGLEEGISIQNNTPHQTGELTFEKYQSLIIKPGSMVIKIYRRELFEKSKIRFPEKMFYEDNAISVLPLLYARRFERVDESLYFYYQHSESTVHTISIERCKDRIKAAEIYMNECKARGFYEQFKGEIEYKVFELGYRNTLFSYLQEVRIPNYRFVSQMKSFLMEYTPNFEQNAYYKQFMDEENQKLIKMHSKNTFVFLIYYKLLFLYRKIRYGKR